MNENETRELTVDELDIEREITRVGFYAGIALAALESRISEPGEELRPPRHERKRQAERWVERFPFLRALMQLALENPGRTRELWAHELQGEQPFGWPPVCMPRVPKEQGQ